MNNLLYPSTNPLAIEQLKLASGEGIYVKDNNGKEYLEGMSGLWCTSLGYNNQELIEAVTKQLETFPFGHMFGGKTHQVAIDLADKLAGMVDIEGAKVFFGSSGSDANDTLVKIVRYYNQMRGKPEKNKIMSRNNAYHGVSLASASLTGLPVFHTNFNLPMDALGILRLDAPHYYRNGLEGESEAEFCDRLVAQMAEMIDREGPDTIAAFIAEPINGAGGVIAPPEGYFQKIQALLDEHDILLLDDEVICAFGRTGNDFGATTVGMKPDTMTLAKALSSAYIPISASVISGEIYDQVEKGGSEVGVFAHGYTYSGHPVGCAAALKTLEIYERDNIFEKAAITGEYLQTKLRSTFAGNKHVGQIRGAGLLAALQLMKDAESKTFFEDNDFVVKLVKQCEKNGLILRPLGDNTLAICPPLVINEEQIDELVDILERSVNGIVATSYINRD